MTIFDFDNYRLFVKSWVKLANTRGAYSAMAKQLGISSTMVSQVIAGEKSFSVENIFDLAQHLGLTEKEADFLFLLNDYDRAGNHRLKERVKNKMAQARREAKDLSQRLKKNLDMSPEAQSVYYSSWLFSAVRNSCTISEFQSLQALTEKLNISAEALNRVVQFLVENGLMDKDGHQIKSMGKLSHVGAKSPLVVKHHQNWRLRGFQTMDNFSEDNLFVTVPMSLSSEHAEALRKELPGLIEKITARLSKEPAQETRCLNIDFFKF